MWFDGLDLSFVFHYYPVMNVIECHLLAEQFIVAETIMEKLVCVIHKLICSNDIKREEFFAYLYASS